MLESAIDALISSFDLPNEEFVKVIKRKILSLSDDDKAKLLQVSGALHYHIDLLRY